MEVHEKDQLHLVRGASLEKIMLSPGANVW